MPNINRLHVLQAGNVVLASELNDEFDQLVNTVNALPDKNGTLQTNLNADLLDSFHASTTGGTNTIPVCNGTLQADLNAALLEGLSASDIVSSAFPTGTKQLFYQASPPGGWTLVTAPADHILTWKSGATGGTNAANSWTVSGITVTVNGHAITINEMPTHTHGMTHSHSMAHTHEVGPHSHDDFSNLLFVMAQPSNNVFAAGTEGSLVNSTGSSVSFNTGASSSANTGNFTGNTTASGNGATHTHTATASQGGGWRPPASYVIIASKN